MKNKIIITSMLIIATLVGFQYWNALQVKTELPSEQWSRSFPVHTKQSNYAKLQSVPNENGYTISLLDFKKLIVLSCDLNMVCETNRTIDKLNTYKNTWSDKTNHFYIRDNNLIQLSSQTGEIEIASNVVNFTKTENTLVYWTEDQQIVVLDHPFSEEIQRFKVDQPISFVKILEDQIFVVTENKKEQYLTVHNLSNQLTKLFNIQLNSSEILSSVHIVQLTGGGYSLLLDKGILSGGIQTKTILAAPFNLTLNQSPVFSKLTFVDSTSGKTIKNIRLPEVYQGKQGPIITFSASLTDLDGNRFDKVFVSNSFADTMEASAVTKADNRYERSTLINDQTVMYFNMLGADRALEYSSSNEELKQESNGIMRGDYLAAGYTFISDLINGLLLVLLSLIWITIVLAITYGSFFVMLKIKFPFVYKTAYMIHIASLFGTLFIFFHKFSLLENIIFRMPYLSESWHFTILLLFSIILPTLPLIFFRYKVSADSFHSIILYTTFMNAIILFFAVGPYLF